MLFTEGRFFAFFLLVLGVHWGLRSHRARKLWLLGCSYVFYAGWDWRFLGLILASTCIDFVAGRSIDRAERTGVRRAWLVVSLGANLGLLGFFKYFNFFAESAADLLRWFGFAANDATLAIVLPVGISFYTFQTMSYSIDIYRRQLEPVESLRDFALFVAFFPQLVAGPIVRAVEFLPQLVEKRSFARHVQVRAALSLFLVGFVKKACVADNAAVVVDTVLAEPAAWTAGSNWLAMLLYHVQLYCDFSGYSDMAIATAGLLGYRLPLNFDFPYLAGNVAELWRRWHISLSTWIRDYVFIPLGGSRVDSARFLLNMVITWGLCGLWHGAGWNFVAWGLVNATYLMVYRVWITTVPEQSLARRTVALLGVPLTTFCWLASLVVFRVPDLSKMSDVFAISSGLGAGGERAVESAWMFFLVGCALVHWAFWRFELTRRMATLPGAAFAIYYGAAWAVVLPWVKVGYAPFIYFQF